MQAFQTSYTLYFNRRHGRSGHVFEQGYKALLVDKDNYLLQVSRYIHRNPVAAKLVARPQDYRWSSYAAYLNGKGVRGLTTCLVLEQLGGKRGEQVRNYWEFVRSGWRRERGVTADGQGSGDRRHGVCRAGVA